MTSGSMNSVWPDPDEFVDDALDSAPGVGPYRHHVPPVPEGDDRFLEGAADVRRDERVQAASQPVIGDPDGVSERSEPR